MLCLRNKNCFKNCRQRYDRLNVCFSTAKLYEVATCMQDKKKGNCLANWDKAGFIDIVEFMRYFKQTPRTLQKEGRLAVPPEQGIPGFK